MNLFTSYFDKILSKVKSQQKLIMNLDDKLFVNVKQGNFREVKRMVKRCPGSGERALKLAIKYNQPEIFHYLIAELPFWEGPEKIMRYAIKHGNLEAIEELSITFDSIFTHSYEQMNGGFYPREKILHDVSFLHLAVFHGHLEVVKYFADGKFQDNGVSLLIAVKRGHLEIVKYLIGTFGAKCIPDEEELMRNAFKNNHLEIAKFLIESGIKCQRDDYGLITAARCGDIEMAEYFLGREAEVNTDHDNPLSAAARNGKLDMVKYLLEEGACINTKYDNPLSEAARGGQLEIVKYLLGRGANIHYNHDEPLACSGSLETAKYLIKRGANIHCRGGQLLQDAARCNLLKLARFLIENDANVHAGNGIALKFAKTMNNSKTIKYLLCNY